MRKYYLDNIRWATVVLVVIYHVLYMYNGNIITAGVLGKITDLDVQYYDLFQYIVYPWFMILLFMVAGICSRLYLDGHTHREFIRSRTRKLLVPSTIGLFAFQFLQGMVNAGLAGVTDDPAIPPVIRFGIYILSGQGVLWFIQLLWIFSMLLVPIRNADRDRLWKAGGKAGLPVLVLAVLPVYGAAQVLNTPIVVVYRFGLYFFVFLFGYFVLSHDEVIEILKKYFPLFLAVSLALGTAFCVRYFGENYADYPVYRSVLFVSYGYFMSLSVIGGMAEYGDVSSRFTQWMNKRCFGLYVFHYLGISSVALFVGRKGILPAPAVYLLSAAAGFGGAFLLFEVISRIPGYRWAVLGMKGDK